MPIAWLHRATLEQVHAAQIAEHGGTTGTTDASALESALARPKNIAAYETEDVFRLAAAYAYAIVRNHPFADGNKRVAFLAAYIFLARNGYRLAATEDAVVTEVMSLAEGTIGKMKFADFLANNCQPRD